jgi:c(7)-type cytochrome triheme protein
VTIECSRNGAWDKKRLALLPLFLILLSCSDETLNFFFDIPPPTEAEKRAAAARERAAEQASAGQDAAAAPAAVAQEGPEIEKVATWQEAEAMLPKDDLDQVDWVEAMKQGIIKPREEIGGPPRGMTAFFKFDFYLPGPDPSFDAFFPHSVHTEWLACESCHPKIFPLRGTQIAMDDVFAGEYCGKCHGIVAYAVDSCARCHTRME